MTNTAHHGIATGMLTATVNVRVSPSTRALIDEVVAREHISIRDVVEQAVLERWGSRLGGTVPALDPTLWEHKNAS